jgi:hypothetical protein
MPRVIRDVFPAEQPLSRFLVSMAMASNDLELAMWNAVEATKARRPESNYWVRLVMGHFIEADDALAMWRESSAEVRKFLGTLPPEGQSALKEVQKMLTKVGRTAVSHARNHTFHYPAPNAHKSDAELAKALDALSDEPLTGDAGARPGSVRLAFADQAALMVAMGKHRPPDDPALRAQMHDLQAGATNFVNFIFVALKVHLDEWG